MTIAWRQMIHLDKLRQKKIDTVLCSWFLCINMAHRGVIRQEERYILFR
jgi:hypothetical protein